MAWLLLILQHLHYKSCTAACFIVSNRFSVLTALFCIGKGHSIKYNDSSDTFSSLLDVMNLINSDLSYFVNSSL